MRDPLNSDEADSNHYALPLSVSPVIDTVDMKVIRIDHLPTGKDNTITGPKPWDQKPANEYMSEYQKLRTDLKPLQVVQPEGTSFTVTEQGTSNVIEWQKWQFRVGFNQREGMVLYDVRYAGRNVFYRASLSDMNIPYAGKYNRPTCDGKDLHVTLDLEQTQDTRSTRRVLLTLAMPELA